MRISDWSSDVCSSDLVRYKTNDVLTVGGNDTADAASLPSHRVRTLRPAHHNLHIRSGRRAALRDVHPTGLAGPITATTATPVHDPRAIEIGRASFRERGCQYVLISVVAGSLQKKKIKLHHINK